MESRGLTEVIRMSIPWVLWSIWKNRNVVLYVGKQEVTSILLQIAMEEARLWRAINCAIPHPNLRDLQFSDVVVASDCQGVMEALSKP